MSKLDDQAPDVPDGNGNGEIGRVLDEFLLALETGEAVDAQELLDRYPQWADVLGPAVAQLVALYRISRNLDAPEAVGPIDLSRGDVKLGDFRIIREIGRGGMGIVYEAEQVSIGRRVALKVLPFAAILNEKQLSRFKNEVRAAGTLQHPHIVPIYAVGCERGIHYYAMQFVDGFTLAEIIAGLRASNQKSIGGDSVASDVLATIARGQCQPDSAEGASECPPVDHVVGTDAQPVDGRLALLTAILQEHRENTLAHIARIVEIAIQAAEALQHAHEQGIVHRDIKPANLMIDSVGHLWITDFGLARLEADAGMTLTGDLLGTLRYMSIEQASGKPGQIDSRSDVYSLGATLYELATQHSLFEDTDSELLRRRIFNEEPIAPRSIEPSIPRDLETAILKATAKVRDDRYASAGAFAADLCRFLEGKPILARRPNLVDRVTKWSRRNRMLVLAGSVVVFAIGIISTVTLLLTQAALNAESREHARAELNLTRAEKNLGITLAALDDVHLSLIDEVSSQRPVELPVDQQVVKSALRYYEQLASANRDNPQLQQLLPDVYRRIGLCHRKLCMRQAAVDAFRLNVVYCERLVDQSPNNAALRLRLAVALNDYGVTNHGNWMDAKGAITPHSGDAQVKQAVELVDRICAENPDDLKYQEARFEIIYSASAIRLPRSDAYRLRGIEIGRQMIKDSPRNSHARWRLCNLLYSLYLTSAECDRNAHLQEALEVSQALDSETVPREITELSLQGMLLDALAYAEYRAGHYEKCRHSLRESLRRYESVAHNSPYEVNAQIVAINKLVMASHLYRTALADSTSALECHQRAINLHDEFLRRNYNSQWQKLLADAISPSQQVLIRANRNGAASESINR